MWNVVFYAIAISGRIAVLPNISLGTEELCNEFKMG